MPLVSIVVTAEVILRFIISWKKWLLQIVVYCNCIQLVCLEFRLAFEGDFLPAMSRTIHLIELSFIFIALSSSSRSHLKILAIDLISTDMLEGIIIYKWSSENLFSRFHVLFPSAFVIFLLYLQAMVSKLHLWSVALFWSHFLLFCIGKQLMQLESNTSKIWSFWENENEI